ncbi:primosomal protein N' [Thiomonas sp. FB-Cd]|uniref:replication restart helicase PriA n=1 Tax=Thiomonas sp. FB-Cd TaxID=1158292 RepID=UPI000571F4BD|nr:primosomal protein N' [Thiomonas sp. FB-Cd]
MVVLHIAVDAPLWDVLDYTHTEALVPGTLVRVPLGRQTVGGVVLDAAGPARAASATLRAVTEVVDALPPLGADWLALLRFAASYYQRPLGELMGAALPGWLRSRSAAAVAARVAAQRARRERAAFRLTPAGQLGLRAAIVPRHAALARLTSALGLAPLEEGASAAETRATPPLALAAARRLHPKAAALLRDWTAQGWVEPVPAPAARMPDDPGLPAEARPPHVLQAAQQAAVSAVCEAQGFAPFLLFGVTGSGKTEVYLRIVAHALAKDPRTQVLVLTPEINLTPPLATRLAERFPQESIALLHSGLAEAERFDHWRAAHSGEARIVLGTRLAALASLPRLALIIVDEEHDPSYKQQEGARYSARDLAVWRARQRGVPVVLGSATPALESWHAAQRGRYRLLELPERAAGRLPEVRLLHARQDPLLRTGGLVGAALQEAILQRLARGEQCLLFINRRGYAPVLRCPDCGWLSDCPHCDAHLVFHRTDRTLRCHHCGHRTPVPRACPDCGSLDLQPLGRGTQRVEEALVALFPQARIARIDADSVRRRGAAQSGFAKVHSGEVDILVGTQMITKGHDFQRVTLVAALNPDAGLFTHDVRGPERLFAQIMQAAGRAGRASGEPGANTVPTAGTADTDGSAAAPVHAAEMLVQTAYPEHMVYQTLRAHDYRSFAAQELVERRRAGMPPFSYQALLRAEHKRPETLEAFLLLATDLAAAPAQAAGLMVYPPVPASLARVAGVHRQHILVEGASRAALQGFLTQWRASLLESKARVRWAIDVDPTEF